MKTFVIGLGLGVLITLGVVHWSGRGKVKFTTPYQAVLLDDNQVFYGKLSSLNAAHPILTDVYYIKSGIDPQSKETKSVLIRRGKELHVLERTAYRPGRAGYPELPSGQTDRANRRTNRLQPEFHPPGPMRVRIRVPVWHGGSINHPSRRNFHQCLANN